MIEEKYKVWFNFNTRKVDNNIDHRKESVNSNIGELMENYEHKKIRGIRKCGF
ncbi:MAG TPA: hypothetical protein VF220_00930 [Nitrososphaeraceae archaeon]